MLSSSETIRDTLHVLKAYDLDQLDQMALLLLAYKKGFCKIERYHVVASEQPDQMDLKMGGLRCRPLFKRA